MPKHQPPRKQVLLALVILDGDEFDDGFREKFLRQGFAVVGQGELDVERQRVRPTVQPPKDRLGFVELIFRQPGDGRAETGRALKALDFEDLPLGFGLDARGAILTDAFAIQPAGNAIGDLPEGFVNSEMTKDLICSLTDLPLNWQISR